MTFCFRAQIMRLRTRKKNLVLIYCVKDQGNGTKIEVTVRSCCEKQFEKKKTLREALKFFDCGVSVRRQIQTSYKNHTTSLRVCTVWFVEVKKFRDSGEISD